MMQILAGVALVVLAGCGTGTMAWPLKTVRKFEFEHVWLVGMFFGLVVIPWTVVYLSVPDPMSAYRQVSPALLVKANLFAVCWGIANVLLGISYVRIGATLSGAILTGLGLCVGMLLPFVLKGTGVFADSPPLLSTQGLVVVFGVLLILIGVALSAKAGFARDKASQTATKNSSDFRSGLIIVCLAGVLSAGISFSFIYAQAPIVEAMKAQGASDIAANCAVWGAGLLGGALVNMVYPAYLMTTKQNWAKLFHSPLDFLISLLFGLQFIAAVVLLGKGMVLLGALGASVGFGIMQSIQILGNQAVGFVSGEWKGVYGRPRTLMIGSVVLLLVAILVLAVGNFLTA